MLVLFCVQIVQTNNNESNWSKKKETTTFYCKQAKDMWPCQEKKIKLKKSIWQDTQGIQTQCRSSH
jgi:hypothetical protein